MREYKRVLKAVAAVTLLSVVAATSSTLAWMQTKRTISISFSDATVRIGSSSLQVDFKESFNTTMTSTQESFTELTLSSETKVTDLSSDGLTFYEPMWSGTRNTIENGGDGLSGYKAAVINNVTPRKPGTHNVDDPGLSADKKFIDFTLTLSRSEESTSGMYVFLGEETELFVVSGDTSSLSVLSSLRMAVIGYSDNDSDSGIPEVILRHTPQVEPNPKYISLGSGGLYGAVGYTLVDDTIIDSTPFVTHPVYEDAITVYPPVADLTITSGYHSADVTFRVWIEGTDKDALEDIVHQEFGLTLDLYVVNAE